MSARNPFLVALLGARMHYAVPRILQGAGRLERFFTDFSAAFGWLQCLNAVPRSVRPASLDRLLARAPQGIPCAKVTAFNRLGWEYARRRRRACSPSEQTAAFLWSGRELCRLVNASPWGSAGGVFTFNSAGLETLRKARFKGLRAVMEQTIAPRQVEQQILACEFATHAGWQMQPEDALVGEYSDREAEEWAVADTILCGSQFVLDGIGQLGGPVAKCVVVPYGVDVAKGKANLGKRVAGRPLRVLTVGAVGLRKGAPYVLAAARALKRQAVFRWVGGVELLPAAAQWMAEAVHLTGAVPLNQVAGHFEWADVFLLPSLCEGSATVTYEALTHGLPVICTPNAGSVVRDGVEGFLVPPANSAGIVERLEDFIREPERLEIMSRNALSCAERFSLQEYGRRLLSVLPC